MWGSVTGAVTGGMTSPYCFVAGTLVCTVDGEVPIEDIEVGDYVLAENPETGEIDYKPVLETYEHDTYDVVYLTIDGEEFTTTEGHPFYTLERGFVKAGELRFSDTLIDDNGNKLHLEKKNKEHLTKPVTVYNFAVEDYHTYFVGENEVLVHNNCGVNTSELSKTSLRHIRKHSFSNLQKQAAHLTDEQLAYKFERATFFNKNWTIEQISQYTQEAYNILRSQNKVGRNIVEIHGELINVVIKADGTFETAFGVYKYFVSDFR